MPSAGTHHTCALLSDGSAIVWGEGKLRIPALHPGTRYTQVSVGRRRAVLVRSDGAIVNCGMGGSWSAKYDADVVQVSTGYGTTAVLLSNGKVKILGPRRLLRQSYVPVLGKGMTYLQVDCGHGILALIHNNGGAIVCGPRCREVTDNSLPALPPGERFTQVSAGADNVAFLRTDGAACVWGGNRNGQCNVPELREGVTYTQVSAGRAHIAFLRSDGIAVACGDNRYGQCFIPVLEEGATYIQVVAGEDHTVLLREDGIVVACGQNAHGQCAVPSWVGFLPERVVPSEDLSWQWDLVVQLELKLVSDFDTRWCECYFRSLSGEVYECAHRVPETDFQYVAQAGIEWFWWQPGRRRLRVVIMPNHGILPRSMVWKDLLEMVGLIKPGPPWPNSRPPPWRNCRPSAESAAHSELHLS